MRVKNVGRWVLSGTLALAALTGFAGGAAGTDVETDDDFNWSADFNWSFAVVGNEDPSDAPSASVVDPADPGVLPLPATAQLERDFNWS